MVDLFVGLVLGNMVAGVIGNRTDALFCQCWQTIYERLRQGSPRDNHDLQRAIRKAILQATLCLLSNALMERGVNVQNWLSRLWRRLPFGQPRDEESRWLWRVYNELSAELSRVSSAEDVPPSPVAENELALLLQPQGVTAEKRAKELQERVTDEWLRELRELSASKQFGEPPEVFVRRLREGWQPPEATERFFWFDLVCAFFAHEIKHNQCVANIVMAKLLAGLTVDEQPLSDALTAYLERRFAPILQRLDDIKQQLDELERQQREGFEELKERQAEIIATLMPMRETQQVMQALLSEVGKWLCWMAENFGKSHVATYLDDATRQFLREKWQQGFVGRKEAMERLNRFVATNPNGVAIVYAPAGYGKTTFLAHWIRQVEETGGWLSGDGETGVAIVRHFFSPTMHLSPSPSNAFAHLLAQLTRLSDQPTPIPDRDDERWAALRNFLANLKSPEGVNKLVIVLDGLDDAEGKVEPFDKIPEGLFVVVSGRWDGEGELPNYLKEWAKFTEFIPLKALSEEEIREWLRTAGEGELARFAENDDFVRMLREKTDGLPLFVRYLMDDLLQAVKEGKSPEQVLERTPKGFSEYVKEQFKQLAKLVRNEKGVRDLFALLTVAKGALRQDEVEELTDLSVWDLEDLPHQVTRWFSIGKTRSSADMPTADMATYSFAHPLLAEEFRKYLGKEARQMEGKLLEWCENWREHPSFPYILRHYAEHLYDKWQMTNEQMTYDALCRLALDSDFKQAQTQHLPDEPNLPLKTVQLALKVAIQLEDALMMARLLIEHAKRAQIEAETPLQAWRKGHRERALELATDIVFKRDHKLGTLWSLFLAWVAESEGEREWSKRFLDEVRKRWEGGKLTELGDWQREMAAFLLGEVWQVEGAIEVAGLVLDDESKRKLATGWASKRLFDQALKLAEGIERAGWRAEALREIAGEMAKAGMFDQALKVAEGIEDADERAEALREIAGEMAKAGMFEQALKVAEGIEKAGWRAWALREIAVGMAKAEMTDWAKEVFGRALMVAEGIEDAWQRAVALAAIAEGMAKAGMEDWAKEVFEQALKVAEGIEDADERARALREIAVRMAEAGMMERAKEVFEQALKVAEGIEKADVRAWALREIAGGMAKAGMFDQALKVAEGIEKAWWRAEALREIAGEMAKAGMFDQALKVAEGIEKAWWRAEALREIAEEMAKAGMFDQALKVAEGIEEADKRAEALAAIAARMAKAGMFDQALKVAEGIEKAWWRAEALREIAEEMAKAGMIDWAKEVFDQALKVAGQARALIAIAGGMAKAGMIDWAKEVFDQALKVAEGIKWARQRARALIAIAGEMAKAGMFDQALKVAEGIWRAEKRVEALIAIAGGMARAGMMERAKEVFDQALKLAEGIEDAGWRAVALREIAEGMAKAGEVEGAVGIVEREMAVRTEGLPSVLQALAERAKQGDEKSKKEGFLKLLPWCGWSLEFAYKACGLLAWLYPERGGEIARVVSGE
jgi:tetratricopeptide (TPR) repeat protein